MYVFLMTKEKDSRVNESFSEVVGTVSVKREGRGLHGHYVA